MSTTFGINKRKKFILLENDCLPDSEKRENYIEIAFRGNGSGLRWKNELAPLMPDDVPVYPLDNSAQGIYTIGDIRREIEIQNEDK